MDKNEKTIETPAPQTASAPTRKLVVVKTRFKAGAFTNVRDN